MHKPQVFTPDQLWVPEFIANPYPTYHSLRGQSPLRVVSLPAGTVAGLNEPLRSWALMRYDDVHQALRDHDTFSSVTALVGKLTPRLTLIQDDPPRHSRLRRIVNQTFTLKRVEALTPWIAGVVAELLDEIGTAETDFVQSYTVPLPMKVIARLLGIPGEDYLTFKHWSEAVTAFTSMSPEERAKNSGELLRYFGRMALARREQAADDLITALVEAEVEGDSLEDPEVLGFCLILLIAGNETTTHLIGNLLNLLADRPDLWSRLREDRSLVDVVVEESLRHESPVQRLPRRTTREVEVSGVSIPADAPVSIFYGAANRDPEAFPEPDVFRLDRDLRHHLGFGSGIHYCLGAPLARAEANLTLNTLLDRFATLKRGAAPAIRQTAAVSFYGFQQLPLVLNA